MIEVAQLVTAFAALVAAITGLMAVVKIATVHKEVKTGNEKAMGLLAAESETRRIEDIPHDKRSKVEQRHVDESPPPDPPQGPAR